MRWNSRKEKITKYSKLQTSCSQTNETFESETNGASRNCTIEQERSIIDTRVSHMKNNEWETIKREVYTRDTLSGYSVTSNIPTFPNANAKSKKHFAFTLGWPARSHIGIINDHRTHRCSSMLTNYHHAFCDHLIIIGNDAQVIMVIPYYN